MGTLVDVTGVDGAPTETTVNGVLIVKSPPEGSGTGNYTPFLAIQDNDGAEEGFNTDASGGTKVLDTDNSKTMTLKLSANERNGEVRGVNDSVILSGEVSNLMAMDSVVSIATVLCQKIRSLIIFRWAVASR